MTSEPVLTIAIPTYNRPVELKRCLEALVPQLNDDCMMCIYDNHSPVPVAEIVKPVFEQHGWTRYLLMRREFNVGGPANIIRCYEMANTPWVWVLGDDDIPQPDAISQILALIAEHPETLAFGFEFLREFDPPAEGDQMEVLIRTPGELLSSRALLSLSLISSCVYNTAAVRAVFSQGYYFASSFYSHLAWLLKSLQINRELPIRYRMHPIVKFVNDGVTESPVTSLYPNIRYLSRMLRNNADRSALMRSSFGKFLIGPPAKRLSRPGFLAIVAAAAFRHLEDSRNLLARARRVAGECLEFDEAGELLPLSGGYASVRLLVAICLGWILGPLIRPVYRLKVRGRRDCPTLISGFDPFTVF